MLNYNLDKERKIFVYGSLMEGFFNHKKYLEGKTLSLEKGTIKGRLYDMPHKGYPAVLQGDDVIYGELFTIRDFKSNLESMDKMEHYYGLDNPKNEYNRIIVPVTLDSGEIEEAYMYFYTLNDPEVFNEKSIYIPYGDWRKRQQPTTLKG
ncbi:MAG: gamma-glutamylcyclotransferase family protein [Clostridium sp.]